MADLVVIDGVNVTLVSAGEVGPPGAKGSAGAAGPASASFSLDGQDGEDGMMLPGAPGTPGPPGIGVQGPPGFGMDGVDGDEGMPIPGAPGAAGARGSAGLPTFSLDGADGEDGMPIPGMRGPGGAPGLQGSPVFMLDGEDGADGMPIPGMPGLGGTSGASGVQGPAGFGMDGVDGDDGMPIPGAAGSAGTPGVAGLQGQPVFMLDGEDGADGMAIPGVRGTNGTNGTNGLQGAPVLMLDGVDGEDGMMVPGAPGGVGAAGAAGRQGAPIFMLDGEDGADGMPMPSLQPMLAGDQDRIINGAMVIQNRSNLLTTTGYPIDRWTFYTTAGTHISATVVNSAGLPGFPSYLRCTATATNTLGSADYFLFSQKIEGVNVVDLAWGTSAAKPITLSFWVRADVAGQYAVTVRSGASARYYTVPITLVHNVWTLIVLTIPGDTSGTWATDNSTGLEVLFCMGAGASILTASPNAWGTATAFGSTGQTNGMAAITNFFDLTGVQLRAGIIYKEREPRFYGIENMLCQRYYEVLTGVALAWMIAYMPRYFKVSKRAVPTLTLLSGSLGGGNMGSPSLDLFYAPEASTPTSTAGWSVSADCEM